MSAKKALDADWRQWVAHNLERGCAREELCRILVENGFDAETAAVATGLKAPPVVVPTQPPGTEAGRVELPLATRYPTDRLELFVMPDFLSEQECIDLTLLVNGRLRASTTTNDEGEYAGYRTSTTCDLSLIDHPLVQEIDRRICAVMGIDASWSEGIQAQRYDVGQQFKAHTDYFEPGTAEYDTYAGARGQRTWTFMVYLNNTRGGGATRFTNLGIEFQPDQGAAVIWNSLHADGTPNPDSVHWGMPVEQGYKIVLTKWFRDRGQGAPFRKSANEYLPPLTAGGFLKRPLPPALFERLRAHYRANHDNVVEERVEGFIATAGNGPASELIEMPDALKAEVHTALQPEVEAWVGDFVEPTYVYGMRRYRDGATLKAHRDRELTHIASAIINIDQQVNEPWPLQIEDHFCRRHEVLLAPGEMVLYEGARLLHGREQPLRGDAFVNIFVHYRLR